MAGIGFRLHQLLDEDTYTHTTISYTSAIAITAGPWLAGVLALLLLSFASTFLTRAEHILLFATISYAFAGSMILAGGPQMLLTRYLADRLYLNEEHAVAPTATGTLLFAVPTVLVILPLLTISPYAWSLRLLALTLTATLAVTWLLMVFLSATRDYARLLTIFALAYALSFVASLALGVRTGLAGSLAGFTIGQVVCVGLLLAHVYLEYPTGRGIDLGAFHYTRNYWQLPVLGVAYFAGIWLDNFIYWWSPGSLALGPLLHIYPYYDTAKLAAYISIVPAGAVFLLHLETGFYTHYREFYRLVVEKGTLAQLGAAKAGMLQAIRDGMTTQLKAQSLVMFGVLVFAPSIGRVLGLPPDRVLLLRIQILVANCQFLMLIAVLLLLYLDARSSALGAVLVFALGNLCLTPITILLGERTYGLGVLVAALAAGILAWWLLARRLRRLQYVTFMLAPMP